MLTDRMKSAIPTTCSLQANLCIRVGPGWEELLWEATTTEWEEAICTMGQENSHATATCQMHMSTTVTLALWCLAIKWTQLCRSTQSLAELTWCSNTQWLQNRWWEEHLWWLHWHSTLNKLWKMVKLSTKIKQLTFNTEKQLLMIKLKSSKWVS